MPRSSTAFSVRLPADLRSELDELARATRRSRNSVITEAVAGYVEEQKAYQAAIKEAEAEADKGILISGERVSEWLRSWGTPNELPMPEPDIFPDKETQKRCVKFQRTR